MKDLISEYNKRKFQIKRRLKEFKELYNKGKDEDVFKELCFCILTPQAKAVFCDSAIKELGRKRLLLKGSESAVRNVLKGLVRFHNKKASYLVNARRFFSAKADKKTDAADIKRKMGQDDVFGARDWLVKNIKGLGYKEASHFLRNIGLGDGLAILDRHILKNLKRYGAVKEVPSSISSRKAYIDIEDKMRRFSDRIKIPLEEMDLLFWSIETGFVFK